MTLQRCRCSPRVPLALKVTTQTRTIVPDRHLPAQSYWRGDCAPCLGRAHPGRLVLPGTMSGIGGTTKRDTEIRLPRATKVKNKQPAAQQVRAFKLSAGSQPPRLRWTLHACISAVPGGLLSGDCLREVLRSP
jgi:hypothetical protein